MAEQSAVSAKQCVFLPDDIGDISAAAIVNPGMSSWEVYAERAKLQVGETVLVNGATGTAGRLTVQIAKYLGARKVIAILLVLGELCLLLMCGRGEMTVGATY